MVYTYNKPDTTDTISSSQAVLKDNFTAIKQFVDINHVTFGLDDQGKHNTVSIPAITVTGGSIPIATALKEWALYTDSITGDLFLRQPDQAAGTVDSDVNLTGGTKADPGWCYLPCGIIMKWGQSGTVARNTLGSATIINGAGIPKITTLLSAQITPNSSDHECMFTYDSFDDSAAYKVYAYNYRQYAGSGTSFRYLILGV